MNKNMWDIYRLIISDKNIYKYMLLNIELIIDSHLLLDLDKSYQQYSI